MLQLQSCCEIAAHAGRKSPGIFLHQCVTSLPIAFVALQDYCLNKDDHQFILDVTQFKSRQPALEDPYKNVPTTAKSAFTRPASCNIY